MADRPLSIDIRHQGQRSRPADAVSARVIAGVADREVIP
jgi:hypothetical protein